MINGKSESHFLKKKKAPKFHWTVAYRRLHKKGASETVAKKKTRRVIKSVRGIVGLPSEELRAKRTEPTQVREAARAEASDAAKAKKKEQKLKKKQDKLKNAGAHAAKPKAAKLVKVSKVMATSR